MIDARLRKEKRIFANKKKVLAILIKATNGMIFSDIAAQLPLSRQCIKGLLIALLKSNDVSHTNGVWFACVKPTPIHKQEPLYPNFNKEHEEWQEQVLAKKPRFNPFGK